MKINFSPVGLRAVSHLANKTGMVPPGFPEMSYKKSKVEGLTLGIS
jgi:hypothetical protein